jgi:hypothetical protein
MVCRCVVASGCFRGGMFGQATDGWVEALPWVVCFVERKQKSARLRCKCWFQSRSSPPRPDELLGLSVLGFESIGEECSDVRGDAMQVVDSRVFFCG